MEEHACTEIKRRLKNKMSTKVRIKNKHPVYPFISKLFKLQQEL